MQSKIIILSSVEQRSREAFEGWEAENWGLLTFLDRFFVSGNNVASDWDWEETILRGKAP
jgi:hypothetical protein